MANADHLIQWRAGKNHSIGYVKSDNGRSRPLYYIQRNAMDWILDRECLRVATGSSMGELQEIAEQKNRHQSFDPKNADCTHGSLKLETPSSTSLTPNEAPGL